MIKKYSFNYKLLSILLSSTIVLSGCGTKDNESKKVIYSSTSKNVSVATSSVVQSVVKEEPLSTSTPAIIASTVETILTTKKETAVSTIKEPVVVTTKPKEPAIEPTITESQTTTVTTSNQTTTSLPQIPQLSQEQKEAIVGEYFKEKTDNIKEHIKKGSTKVKDFVVEYSVEFIDFMFYEKSIKGVTRKELSDRFLEVLTNDFNTIKDLVNDVGDSQLYKDIENQTKIVLGETKEDAIWLWEKGSSFTKNKFNQLKKWYENKTNKN